MKDMRLGTLTINNKVLDIKFTPISITSYDGKRTLDPITITFLHDNPNIVGGEYEFIYLVDFEANQVFKLTNCLISYDLNVLKFMEFELIADFTNNH